MISIDYRYLDSRTRTLTTAGRFWLGYYCGLCTVVVLGFVVAGYWQQVKEAVGL